MNRKERLVRQTTHNPESLTQRFPLSLVGPQRGADLARVATGNRVS